MSEQELLQTIAINTKPKSGFGITLSGKTTRLSTSFSPELIFEGNWGVALQNLSTYNSIANINSSNNKFKYYNGTAWKTITVGTGSYEISELSDEITRLMKLNKDYDIVNDSPYLYFKPNYSRLTTELYLENNYKVDFNIPNSIGQKLGYSKTIVDKSYNESTNPINIINVNSILVHCDLVQSSYYNGKPSNIIYSFPINTAPGFRMISEPLVQRFHRVLVDKVGTMDVWLTDDNLKPLDLRKELLTINLWFQEL